jgi:hypothetical protein
VSLVDQYYKVVFAEWSQFGSYQYVVDTWGDRCFKKEGGNIYQLTYDQFGKANNCIEKFNEEDHYYISYYFKQFDLGKSVKFESVVLPNLTKSLPTTTLTLAGSDTYDCKTDYPSDIATATCQHKTNKDYINVCYYKYDITTNALAYARTDYGN